MEEDGCIAAFLIKNEDGIRDATSCENEHLVGTCPYCGARVYTKMSCRGLPFVCLFPGEKHTSPVCEAKASSAHQPVAGMTSKEAFFEKIYTEISRKAQRPVNNNRIKKGRKDYDFRALASAKDIQLSGYMDFGPRFKIWTGDICTIAMREEWLPECYPMDLSGNKIILAHFDELDEKALTCELSMSNMGYYARFLVQGTETTMYDFYKDLCCYQRDEKDSAIIVLKSKYSGVYFAAEWNRRSCAPEECIRAEVQGCDKCFGCYITGLVSPRQYTGAR